MQNINKYIDEYQKTKDYRILNKLYNQYESVLVNIAKHNSYKTGEDYATVFSDTFMLFMNCLKNFDNTKSTKFETYLISSSKFMNLNCQRKNNHLLYTPDIKHIKDDYLKHILDIRLMKEKKLFPVYVLLVNGLNISDIVLKLNISKSTAYRRVGEIKEFLKKVIEDYEN